MAAIRSRGRRLVFSQAMDALTFVAFYVLVGPSIHAEQNPVVLGLMALGGVQLVAFVKIGLAAVVARRMSEPSARSGSRFRVVRVTYPAMSTFMALLAIATGIVGAGFNTAAIVDSVARHVR